MSYRDSFVRRSRVLMGCVAALSAAFSTGLAMGGDIPLTTERLALGFSRPVYLTHAPNDFDRVFVIEQHTGRIRIVNRDTGVINATPFLTQTGLALGNEQGLLGLAFHPDYANNGFFYINYTDSGGTTRIRRYTVSANPDIADAASGLTILSIAQPFSNHNGGWMGFGPDAYLYIATGDGGSGNDPQGNGQNLNTLLGKMLRIDVDGNNGPGGLYGIPATNPFVGQAGRRGEIYHYGLRNPWRDSFDRATGDLYMGDVGQNQWEEISFARSGAAGGNYGWRCMEANACTGLTGCTCGCGATICPIQAYSHAGGNCSVTGGYVYRGCAMPEMNGIYFYADYCSAQIWSFRYSQIGGLTEFTNRTAELDPAGASTITTITSFGEDAYGEVYIVEQGGEIWRIVANNANGFSGPDCNNNGQSDACDLLSGDSSDCNGNGIPDECDRGPCPADWDGNGTVNAADVGAYLSTYFDDVKFGTSNADWDGDCDTDALDVGAFLNAYFESLGPCEK